MYIFVISVIFLRGKFLAINFIESLKEGWIDLEPSAIRWFNSLQCLVIAIQSCMCNKIVR